MAELRKSEIDGKVYDGDMSMQQAATTELGSALASFGLRASGSAYPITTSGAVALSGVTTMGDVRTTSGAGAVVAGMCTAVEYGDGVVHKTVLTLSMTGATKDIDLLDGDHGLGAKIYDMPAGRILLLGATIDATVAYIDAATTGNFVVSVGSVTAADDETLSSTEADVIPSTTIAGAATPKAWHGALATSAAFDGTGTAMDIFVNVACPNASNSATAQTYSFTGTLTLTWINLGTY